jgi:hypothetical protein
MNFFFFGSDPIAPLNGGLKLALAEDFRSPLGDLGVRKILIEVDSTNLN